MSLLTRTRSMFPTFPTLFQNVFEDDDDFGRFFASRDVVPAVNVREMDKYYEIEVAAPGLRKSDFNISLDDNQLTVWADTQAEQKENGQHFLRKEFSYSSFRRVFTLPDDVMAQEVKAAYENGILTIRLGKMAMKARPEPKRIPIQ